MVRTRGTDPFQLDMEYVLYVKAEDQNGRIDDRRYQSTPEERLSIVGGKRAPQFYMQTYEAEIPENQRKDSEYDFIVSFIEICFISHSFFIAFFNVYYMCASI